MRRQSTCIVLLAIGLVVPGNPLQLPAAWGDAESAAIERRLSSSVKFLASDHLEGRGIATAGIDLAADYIAQQFSEIGLKTDLYDGKPFQEFSLSYRWKMGPRNVAQLRTPAQEPPVDLRLGRDFQPLSISAPAPYDAPLVFAGYGISAPDLGYDDYADIDVRGKAVVILRHEPARLSSAARATKGRFSKYAYFSHKIPNAASRGAALIILVTDEQHILQRVAAQTRGFSDLRVSAGELNDDAPLFDDPKPAKLDRREEAARLLAARAQQRKALPDSCDPLLRFEVRSNMRRSVPVIHCTRAVANGVLRQAASADLHALEAKIAAEGTPLSQPLGGWQITGETSITRTGKPLKNVLGLLDAQGDLAEETVVIGAHYDHIGMGGFGTLAPWTVAVHNGADDNASGTAVLIEVARQLADRGQPLRRRVLFIAFSAEESGLIGSQRYVRQPLIALSKTVAMVNFDMVGRLRSNRLMVHGAGSANVFPALLDRLGEQYQFQLRKGTSGYGPSDHASFYARGIPVMHFFTGLHQDYHRPSDDFEKLNVPGMRRIALMATDTIVALANADSPPQPAAGGGLLARQRPRARPGIPGQPAPKAFLGVFCDPKFAGGVKVLGVNEGGPAQIAGIRKDDIINHFDNDPVKSPTSLANLLLQCKPEQKVVVRMRRGAVDLEITATLANRVTSF